MLEQGSCSGCDGNQVPLAKHHEWSLSLTGTQGYRPNWKEHHGLSDAFVIVLVGVRENAIGY